MTTQSELGAAIARQRRCYYGTPIAEVYADHDDPEHGCDCDQRTIIHAVLDALESETGEIKEARSRWNSDYYDGDLLGLACRDDVATLADAYVDLREAIGGE